VLLFGAFALLLTACPPEEPTPPAPPDNDEPIGLDASCTNDEVGYTVSYPAEWHVNEGDVLPLCSAFDPQPITIPDATDIPTDIAVVIRAEAIAFAELSDPADDPGVEVRDRDETTLDGRSAVALELEATGEGLHAEGLVTYRYVIEDGRSSIVAETHDVTEAQPAFDQRRQILDAMMRSMSFIDVEDPPEAIPPLEGEPTTEPREEDGESPMVSVTDVRVGTHVGFDRVVVEIGGEGEAGWDIRYDDDPRTAGKGEPVEIEGDAVLALTLTNIAMPVEPDIPEGVEPWDEDRVAGPPRGIITEVVNDTVFEGWHTIFVGLEYEAAFIVARFDDPQRVVVDLFH
jgi:hypothetical protein